MAKERLNELQKWILVKCYEHRDNDFPRGIIARRQLIYISNKITPSFGVSVSRAIWSLIDKGYARGLNPISVDDMAMKDLGKYKSKEKLVIPLTRDKKAKIITLTKKGEKQAKELLMLNSDTG